MKNNSTLNGKVIRVMWSHRDSDGRKSGIANVFVKVHTSTVCMETFKSFSCSLLFLKLILIEIGFGIMTELS